MLQKKDLLNLSDGDINKSEAINSLQETDLAQTLPVTKEKPQDKDKEFDMKETHLKEIKEAYECARKYCEQGEELSKALIDAEDEILACKKLLQMKDDEIDILKKLVAEDSLSEFEQLVKELTVEMEALKEKNKRLETRLKNNGNYNPSELEKINEELEAKVGEQQEKIKSLNEDKQELMKIAEEKIDSEQKRCMALSEQLDQLKEQTSAAK